MIRSLFAVILATVIGLTVAKLIESVGMSLFPAPHPFTPENAHLMAEYWSALPVGYKGILALGWGVGALIASAIALLLGKRWAPLGYLAAASIALQLVITLGGVSAEIWLWLTSLVGVAGGAYVSDKLLSATKIYPTVKKLDPFSD